MRFTPDDGQLVTCGEDHVIRFWRTTDGLLDRTVATQKSEGQVVDISPDAKIGFWLRAIETARGDAVQLLNLDSGKIIGTPYILTGPVTRSQFSPDAKRLALVDPNGPVTILDVGSGKVSISGIEHTRNLSSVEWSPDGRRLLTAGTDGQVLVWDAESGKQLLAPLRLPVGSVNSPHWRPEAGSSMAGVTSSRPEYGMPRPVKPSHPC